MNGPKLIKNIFCAQRFFSYSLTDSDVTEETTSRRVLSPLSIMMRHGFKNKEVRRARKKWINPNNVTLVIFG